MTSKKNKARNAREANRKFKKKANPLKAEKVEFIDYKDVAMLQRFMSDRSKIRGQRMNGTDVQQQREIANAIKNAREMALLPYTKRVTTTRAPRPGADRREEESAENESSVLVDDIAINDEAVIDAGDIAADASDIENVEA